MDSKSFKKELDEITGTGPTSRHKTYALTSLCERMVHYLAGLELGLNSLKQEENRAGAPEVGVNGS